MTIGGGLFLIAVGAIMRYAIVDRIAEVNLKAAGSILMLIGFIGLVLGLILAAIDAVRGRGRAHPIDDRY